MDDVQAIKKIVLSYAELLDLGDIDGLAKLFTRATVHTQGSAHQLHGADAVKELIERGVHLYDGIPNLRGESHFILTVYWGSKGFPSRSL